VITAEELWRSKSDEELVLAARELGDYTEVGRRIILAELASRQLETEIVLEAATDSPLPDRNFLGRLWRGEFSLPLTYWVWGALGNRVVVFIADVVSDITDNPLVALLVLACEAIYTVIIVVAVWRSSRRYKGRRLWRDLSRVSVALGLLLVIAMMFASAWANLQSAAPATGPNGDMKVTRAVCYPA
jgi:hypothetical protein